MIYSFIHMQYSEWPHWSFSAGLCLTLIFSTSDISYCNAKAISPHSAETLACHYPHNFEEPHQKLLFN